MKQTRIIRTMRRGSQIAAIMLLAACQEQPLPEVSIGTAVFSFEGTVDGENVLFVAGEAGIFQHTSFSQNEEGLYQFTGNLAEVGCPECPVSIGITIRDQELRALGALLSEAGAPGKGEYAFYQEGKTDEFAQVAFEWNDNSPLPASMNWELGDGNTTNVSAPVYVYRDTTLETVTVCLQTETMDGCIASICNVVNLVDTSCQASYQYEVDPSAQYVTFSDRSKGALPLKYQWTFGDGYSATLGNPGYYYGSSGKQEACLRIEDKNGCVSEICQEISPDLSVCTAGFSYRVERIEEIDPIQTGACTLTWVDDAGVIFSSAKDEQPSLSYMEIESAERYDNNAEGTPTWKIKVKVQAVVYDEAGNERLVKGAGTMAMAVPLRD